MYILSIILGLYLQKIRVNFLKIEKGDMCMRTYSNFALVNLKKPQVESNRLGDIKVTTQDGTRIEFNTRDMVCIACVLGGNLTVNECYIGGLVGSDLVSEDNVLRFPISNIIFIAKE